MVKMISFNHNGADYANFDIDDPDAVAYLESQIGSEALNTIIAEETGKQPEKTEIEMLREENQLLKAQVQANADRADFQEELIVEMAMMLYP